MLLEHERCVLLKCDVFFSLSQMNSAPKGMQELRDQFVKVRPEGRNIFKYIE